MSEPLTPPNPQQDIVARFRHVVGCLPDHPAVVDKTGAATYAALDAASRRLAAHLAAHWGTDSEPVALLLPNSVLLVQGMLGVLAAGKFYVPLDPAAEAGSQRALLQLSTARILLTTSELAAAARSLAVSETQIVAIDALAPAPDFASPEPAISPQAYASLTFTSGSTGTPKGILWHHGAWCHRALQAVRYDRMTPDDRVSQLFSPAFAVCSSIVLLTLLNGATLYPSSAAISGGMFDWLRDQAITIFLAPVGLLRDQLSAGRRLCRAPTVRSVILGGQSLFYRDLIGLPELVAPDCEIVNRLSMSEFHIVTRYVVDKRDIRPSADPVPVGYPVADSQVLLWDESGQPVPAGEVGQIVVRSSHLTPGYWRNPDLMAEKFLPDPAGGDQRIFLTGDRGRMRPDGCLEYLGRQDLMVKIRGYRVEPEAIERALLAHPAIRDCAVAPQPQPSGEQRLVAYLACRGGDRPTDSQLRAFLAGSLPAYMVPARFVMLECLPRNVNGKIDRPSLPQPGGARPALDTPFVAPRSGLECRLADMWAGLLELSEVGVNDNFFELGGDSLLLLRMSLEIEAQFRQQLPPNYVHSPTIAVLARALTGEPMSLEAPPLHPLAMRLRRGRFEQLLRGEVTAGRAAVMALRWGAARIALRMPYLRGARWLAWWCAQPLAQGLLFRRERDLLRRLADELGMPAPDSEARRLYLLNIMMSTALQQLPVKARVLKSQPLVHMASSRHRLWRTLAKEIDLPGRPALVIFDGRELFQQARSQGRGVVVVTYHSATRELANALLTCLAPEDGFVVPSQAVGRKHSRRADIKAWEAAGSDPSPALRAREIAWSAAQAMEGLRTLRAGGVVVIIPDGAMEDMPGAQRRSVGGRAHRIGPGFAELALSSQAPILPMYSRFERSGAIRITFLPPLHAAPGLGTHAERVDALVTQHARFLEEAWRAAPESLPANQIDRYLRQPPAAANHAHLEAAQ
jgi:amino acid adenylation domain-containing protein